MNSDKLNSPSRQWIIIAACAVVIIGAVVAATWMTRADNEVSNFEQCRDAGGMVMESYPEQCSHGGKTYVNESQQPESGNEYIGLSEEAALDKASQSSTPARVVERDGESLPVTMDHVVGRLNFMVRGGEIYMVDVEGQAVDGSDLTE